MRLTTLVVTCFASAAFAQAPLPMFDTHVHYSHDAWDNLPPPAAIKLLRDAGLTRVLMSSSNDEGQQRIVQLAPDLVVPSLRPYRSRADTSSWARDASVPAYLEERLKKFRYAAVGEFHLYGADADLPTPRRMVELAKQYRLILHAHSDRDAVHRLFAQWPQARVLWAHSGFDSPDDVRQMLKRYPMLWADLAYRTDHLRGNTLDPAWRELFVEFPNRFTLGSDTFTPERWYFVKDHAATARAWLATLPKTVAEGIAHRNGEALLGEWSAAKFGAR